MYFKDEEHWTTYCSVVSCNKEDAHYVDITEYELLEEQNAALVATVEALRGGIEKAKDELSCCNVNSAGERLAHLLELTPQHHLREVRAEAVRKAFDVIFSSFDFGQYNARLGLLDEIESLFIEHADQILQGKL